MEEMKKPGQLTGIGQQSGKNVKKEGYGPIPDKSRYEQYKKPEQSSGEEETIINPKGE